MYTINDNFRLLPENYLFSEVARRINAFKAAHPEADVIRMGIGDVTLPLCPAAIEAMHKAVDDEGNAEFRNSVDLGLTIDERLADGYYYSKSVRMLKYILEHPECLEKPFSEPVEY